MKVKIWTDANLPDQVIEGEVVNSRLEAGTLQITAMAVDGRETGWALYAPGVWQMTELLEPASDEVRAAAAEQQRQQKERKPFQGSWGR